MTKQQTTIKEGNVIDVGIKVGQVFLTAYGVGVISDENEEFK